MKIKNLLKSAGHNQFFDHTQTLEDLKILAGQQLFAILKNQKFNSIHDYEFRVFSQWGDDGIIQYLIHNIKLQNKTFIEFGVQDYSESNTRYLLMNDNWSGFIMDGSAAHVETIKSQNWYWKYDLTAEARFVTKENVNELLQIPGFKNVGILHIDIDGVDYWVWESTDVKELNPSIVIIEYNSVFGKEKELTVPYKPTFYRSDAHYSNLYYGASLRALVSLSNKKGYVFIGCNSSGNNAYFVRKDLQNDSIKEISIDEGFVDAKFRESRNKDGSLLYLKGNQRINYLKGLDIYNVTNGAVEKI